VIYYINFSGLTFNTSPVRLERKYAVNYINKNTYPLTISMDEGIFYA
jgi:hypothetical protein